jgi:HEAT repeat protein
MVTLLDASPETLKRPLAGADTEPMNKLPPEDQPDVVWVGPVGPIPIRYEDDPRFEEERAAWSHARKKAQALHSAEELLGGVVDDDWRVRCESIDRLAARWHDDPRTLPALLDLAEHDSVWQVRSGATMRLVDFDPDAVAPVARQGMSDPSADVRWSANFVLFQFGLSKSPYEMLDGP